MTCKWMSDDELNVCFSCDCPYCTYSCPVMEYQEICKFAEEKERVDKMTKEEVIKILCTEQECVKRQNGTMCDNKRDCENCDLCLDSEMILKAFDIAIESIGRETPKKPLPEERYYGIGKCPNCNAVFLDKSTNYCGNCG